MNGGYGSDAPRDTDIAPRVPRVDRGVQVKNSQWRLRIRSSHSAQCDSRRRRQGAACSSGPAWARVLEDVPELIVPHALLQRAGRSIHDELREPSWSLKQIYSQNPSPSSSRKHLLKVRIGLEAMRAGPR